MKTRKLSPSSLKIISLISIGGLFLYAGFTRMAGQTSIARLQQEPLNLAVNVIRQSRGTSCGEAVITMVYNYAFPQTPMTEQEVIDYAAAHGYFTEGIPPFTSPANMVRIAEYYADDISTGTVTNSGQGLALLIQNLRNGDPVIIDVLSNFHDPESEAHFIVVTGMSVDPNRENAVVIHYNDPLTGIKESADWAGGQGVWNAWQNNGDPGGPGWWLVISGPG
ncbi:MAG TPA: papain-like cysteine protease family protein [Anaerolineales bacterium]|nr:papain-like cysteine protease family protein [Anaerolineales bacterium]